MDISFEYQEIEHQWIEMSDGVRLSARLWIPQSQAGELPPVVLEYIPYRKRDSYRMHDSAWGHALASRGIGFARVDIRGTGDSEGVLLDEYSEQELDDGVCIIEWLAGQHWCNGQVGMRGISWGAINSLQIAARRPQALGAIIAIAGCDNRFTDDAHYLGGLYGRPNLEWGVLFKSVMASPPDPEIVGERWRALWQQRLEASPAIISQWSQHHSYDDYWQRGSIAENYAAINCPTYLVAGWLDTYSNPIGHMFEGLQVPRKGLIGCWGHTYPETAVPNGIDWIAEEVRWWQHWLQQQDTGIMDEPQLWVFQPDVPAVSVLPQPVPGQWIAQESWPPAESDDSLLKFTAAGLEPSADSQSAGSGSHTRDYVPAAPVGQSRVEWLNLPPGEQSVDDAASLVFDSAPLPEALAVLGYPQVTLRLAAQHAAASICIRLNEVDSNGRSWPVSYFIGSLNQLSRSVPASQFKPDAFEDLLCELRLCCHQFQRGSRIRIAISEGLWPMTLPAPERSRLSVELAGSSLQLPRTQASTTSDAFPVTLLEPGRIRPAGVMPVIEQLADGSYRCDQPGRSSSYTDPEIGTQLSSEVSAHSHWQPGGSCRWRQQSERRWQRGGWDCRVIAGCELTSDTTTLEIHEWLRAYEGEVLIHTNDSVQTVPRGC